MVEADDHAFPFDRRGTTGRKTAFVRAWQCPVMVVFRAYADLKRFGRQVCE
jgi:hypothetical protein